MPRKSFVLKKQKNEEKSLKVFVLIVKLTIQPFVEANNKNSKLTM